MVQKGESVPKRNHVLRCVALVLLLLSVASVAPLLAETEPVHIEWDASQPITWALFQASPPADASRRTEAAAIHMTICWHATYTVSSTDGTHWTSHLATISVTNTMEPSLSWAVPGKTTASLLEHEQTHFDLGEVYRRKIDHQLRLVSPCTARSQQGAVNALDASIRAIGDALLQQWRAMTELYDSQTAHGTNVSEQLRWQSLIAAWLLAPATAP